MSHSDLNYTTNVDTADSSLKSLYKIAGLAVLIAVLLSAAGYRFDDHLKRSNSVWYFYSNRLVYHISKQLVLRIAQSWFSERFGNDLDGSHVFCSIYGS